VEIDKKIHPPTREPWGRHLQDRSSHIYIYIYSGLSCTVFYFHLKNLKNSVTHISPKLENTCEIVCTPYKQIESCFGSPLRLCCPRPSILKAVLPAQPRSWLRDTAGRCVGFCIPLPPAAFADSVLGGMGGRLVPRCGGLVGAGAGGSSLEGKDRPGPGPAGSRRCGARVPRCPRPPVGGALVMHYSSLSPPPARPPLSPSPVRAAGCGLRGGAGARSLHNIVAAPRMTAPGRRGARSVGWRRGRGWGRRSVPGGGDAGSRRSGGGSGPAGLVQYEGRSFSIRPSIHLLIHPSIHPSPHPFIRLSILPPFLPPSQPTRREPLPWAGEV
jgi:hypothetical protein